MKVIMANDDALQSEADVWSNQSMAGEHEEKTPVPKSILKKWVWIWNVQEKFKYYYFT